jgi:hypothetical protein
MESWFPALWGYECRKWRSGFSPARCRPPTEAFHFRSQSHFANLKIDADLDMLAPEKDESSIKNTSTAACGRFNVLEESLNHS